VGLKRADTTAGTAPSGAVCRGGSRTRSCRNRRRSPRCADRRRIRGDRPESAPIMFGPAAPPPARSARRFSSLPRKRSARQPIEAPGAILSSIFLHYQICPDDQHKTTIRTGFCRWCQTRCFSAERCSVEWVESALTRFCDALWAPPAQARALARRRRALNALMARADQRDTRVRRSALRVAILRS
jgi:hypothetical protein